MPQTEPISIWGYAVIATPYMGFFLIPFLTHIYASRRERESRLNTTVSSLESLFEKINTTFFESIAHYKKDDNDDKSDAVREQQIIIYLEQIRVICLRAALITNLDEKFPQKEISTMRRIATNDRRRTPAHLTESARHLASAQNDILESINRAKINWFISSLK